MLGKEGVFCGAETIPDRLDVVLRDHADGFPLFLEFLHSLVLVAPVFIAFLGEFFYLLANFFLQGEVLFAFLFLFLDDRFALLHNFFEEGAELVAEFV